MTRQIKQIQQDLTVLEEQVASIRDELRQGYGEYLEQLSQSVQKQLVIASYQICTQAYPEAFLELSFSQRQKFQQQLRQAGRDYTGEFFKLLGQMPKPTTLPNRNLIEQMINSLIAAKARQEAGEEQPDDIRELFSLSDLDDLTISDDDNDDEYEEDDDDDNEENYNEEKDKNLVNLQDLAASIDNSDSQAETINSPDVLIDWYKHLEKGIHDKLERLSRQANRLMQEYRILPQKLPSKFLEMAMQAEEEGAAISGPPNLLNLLVERESSDNAEPSQISKITALHLRLTEIEFSDASLSVKRNQIRNILGKLHKIRQQYSKVKRELAVGEAEAAWRSCWYEDGN